MSNTELELVPTVDLLAELERRFDNLMVAGSRRHATRRTRRLFRWHCLDIDAGVGLLANLSSRMIASIEQRSRPTG